MFIGFACFIMAIINYFMLIVEPKEKGIVIHEIDEKTNLNEEMLRRYTNGG
jgi:hypothetical protein